MHNSEQFRAFMQLCLRALACREHSRAELAAKANGVDASVVTAVLDTLNAQGLQSDMRFCESYIHSRATRGDGPIKIRYALCQRGIADDVINSMLTSVDWYTCAKTVYGKKFSRPPCSAKDRAKRQRFLAQRGFTFDEIKIAMLS